MYAFMCGFYVHPQLDLGFSVKATSITAYRNHICVVSGVQVAFFEIFKTCCCTSPYESWCYLGVNRVFLARNKLGATPAQ
jgi:hypothetical protein